MLPPPVVSGSVREAHVINRFVAVTSLALVGLTTQRVDALSQAPSQVAVAVGILQFQDESGAGLPTMGLGAAQLVRQRLSSQHRDTLVKLLREAGAEATAGPSTIEQLQTLGRQHGVKYVIQGGILPIEAGPSGDAATVTVSLYADVVALDSGQTQTLRVDGTANAAPPEGATAEKPATDVTSAAFARTPVGQALGDAVARLTDAIYQSITAAPAGAAPPPSEQPAPQAAAPQELAAEAPPSLQDQDAEIQQLVADSQTAIMNYGGAAPQLADQLRVGLDQLSAALAQKADQMARGEDTQAVDQSIAQGKESVRASLDALVQAQMNAQAALPPDQSGAPSESALSRLNTVATEMLGLVQKIEDLRALLGGASQEAAAAGAPQGTGEYPSDAWVGSQPVEQSPGSVTGVVVQDGQPVGGAEVSETSTGMTTTTAPDGSYTLTPLPPGLLGVLSVRRQGKLLATGQAHVLSARASVADFQLQKTAAAGTRAGVLGSTAMRRVGPANAGTLTGRVVDARGNPVARALVVAPGAGVVRTNARGEFVMTGVPAAAYTLSVRDAGRDAATSTVKIVAGAPPAVSVVRLPLVAPGRVAPAGQAGLLVAAASGAVVHGRIRDERGRDLAGVVVNLLRGEGVLSVRTDGLGRFALRGVSPGAYRVVVARPGFDTATRNVSVKAKDDKKIELTLKQVTTLVDAMRRVEASRHAAAAPAAQAGVATRPPAPKRDTTVPDSKATAVPPRTTIGRLATPRIEWGQVQGHVVDAQTRRPIGGATISVSGGGSAVTDRNGLYRVANVPPGARAITVSRAGYGRQERTVTIAAGRAATADIALRPAVRLLR